MKYKTDKGVAGLTIMLSLVVMLFMIGLIVALFSIMGGELVDNTYDITTVSVVNETITGFNYSVGDLLSASTRRDVVCTVSTITNFTDGVIVPTSNYTATNCLIKATNGSIFANRNVNVTYSYTWSADNTATTTMNGTTTALATSVDWFDLFIVIGAMVVMIALTVLIISVIRSSGLVAGGMSNGANKVGTA